MAVLIAELGVIYQEATEQKLFCHLLCELMRTAKTVLFLPRVIGRRC